MPHYKRTPTVVQRNAWYKSYFIEAFKHTEDNFDLHMYLYTDLYILISVGTVEQDEKIQSHLLILMEQIRKKCNAKI